MTFMVKFAGRLLHHFLRHYPLTLGSHVGDQPLALRGFQTGNFRRTRVIPSESQWL